jgi:NFU1 iron-sulfur cluster scaffold homolog, mitochondrial
MPKIDNIEETPNPNAVKFVLKEPVSAGAARSFRNAAEAAEDPLARSVFEVGPVVSVFYMGNMITVEKEDAEDWDDLLPRLAVPIRAAAAAGGKAASAAAASAAAPAATTAAAAGAGALGGALGAVLSDDPRLLRINEILDERIRPYLAADGGWLEVVGLTEHTLTIRYQGACGSCPSSLSGTLMAIEGMLQQEIDPQLEVVTV